MAYGHEPTFEQYPAGQSTGVEFFRSVLKEYQSLSETPFALAHKLDHSTNLTVCQADGTYGLYKGIFTHLRIFGFVRKMCIISCLTSAEGKTPGMRTLCDDPEDFVIWDADYLHTPRPRVIKSSPSLLLELWRGNLAALTHDSSLI